MSWRIKASRPRAAVRFEHLTGERSEHLPDDGAKPVVVVDHEDDADAAGRWRRTSNSVRWAGPRLRGERLETHSKRAAGPGRLDAVSSPPSASTTRRE